MLLLETESVTVISHQNDAIEKVPWGGTLEHLSSMFRASWSVLEAPLVLQSGNGGRLTRPGRGSAEKGAPSWSSRFLLEPANPCWSALVCIGVHRSQSRQLANSATCGSSNRCSRWAFARINPQRDGRHHRRRHLSGFYYTPSPSFAPHSSSFSNQLQP